MPLKVKNSHKRYEFTTIKVGIKAISFPFEDITFFILIGIYKKNCSISKKVSKKLAVSLCIHCMQRSVWFVACIRRTCGLVTVTHSAFFNVYMQSIICIILLQFWVICHWRVLSSLSLIWFLRFFEFDTYFPHVSMWFALEWRCMHLRREVFTANLLRLEFRNRTKVQRNYFNYYREWMCGSTRFTKVLSLYCNVFLLEISRYFIHSAQLPAILSHI